MTKFCASKKSVPNNSSTLGSYGFVIPVFIFRSPTMAGGLFAMERKYFFESGAYDRELTYWGGENVEMSFRVSY